MTTIVSHRKHKRTLWLITISHVKSALLSHNLWHTVLPPSYFLGRLLPCPVSRSRRSVTAIYTLFGGILMPPPSLPVYLPVVAPWLLRRRIALSRWLKLALVPEVMLAHVDQFGRSCLPLAMLWFSLRVAFIVSFCSVGTRLGFSFHFLPALLFRIIASCL